MNDPGRTSRATRRDGIRVHYRYRELAFYLVLYAVFVLVPLMVASMGSLPVPRGFWAELALALGFVAYGLMILQFVLTGRFRNIGSRLGLDKLLQFHRQTGILAVVFVLAHAGVFLVQTRHARTFLNPWVNLPRAVALTAAVLGLGVLLITSLWRRSFRLQYEHWRLLHGVVAALVLVVALAHVLRVGHYVSPTWKQAAFVLMAMVGFGFYAHGRLIKPALLLRRPYRVKSCTPRRGSCWSLVLEPEDHGGLAFRPGQFVWLTLGESPFSLQQHPFSLSSSAERPERLELTIKEVGDFTAGVKDVSAGTPAYLEGPYGSFTPESDSGGDLVLVAGGVGIAPIMSILRTLRDRGTSRSLHLIYAARDEGSLTFREEIEELGDKGVVSTTFVLEDPGDEWRGARGRITGALLRETVPVDPGVATYFVCGPEPMTRRVEDLLLERGIPLRCIFTENFEIV